MDGIKVAGWLEPEHVQDREHGGNAEMFNDSLSSFRKEKRSVPDSEKDEKYWDKRQRNNVAAKRSRENKRLEEFSTRRKVAELERENSMLRREIEVLKKKFDLPMNQSFLTETEQEQIDKEWKAKELSIRRGDAREISICDDSKGAFPVSLVRNTSLSSHGEKHQEQSMEKLDNSFKNRFDEHREKEVQRSGINDILLAASLPFCTDYISKERSQSPRQSINSGKHYKPSQFDVQYYLPYDITARRPFPTEISAHTKKHRTSRDRIFNESPNGTTAEENHEIKMKLMMLSAQVDEMKNAFLKKE